MGNRINCDDHDQITVTASGEVDLGIFVRGFSKTVDPPFNEITFEISGKINKIYQVKLDNLGSVTQNNGVNLTTEWTVSGNIHSCDGNRFINGGVYMFCGKMYVKVKVNYVQVMPLAEGGKKNFEQVLTVEYMF
jgi:hypothetical protein